MDYTTWKETPPTEVGNGCFKTPNENKCEDKFCDGESCKQFLEYRLRYLNEQLQSATEHRKEHILQSIEKTEIKLSLINKK